MHFIDEPVLLNLGFHLDSGIHIEFRNLYNKKVVRVLNLKLQAVLCSFLHVHVDPYLKRQLMLRSQYDIKCSLLEDPIIKSTITAVAKSNINDLRPVCEKGTVWYRYSDLYKDNNSFLVSELSY